MSDIPGFDHDRVVAAVRELLIGIGEDPDREGLKGTPERVARSYAEIFAGLGQNAADLLRPTCWLRRSNSATKSWCVLKTSSFGVAANTTWFPSPAWFTSATSLVRGASLA